MSAAPSVTSAPPVESKTAAKKRKAKEAAANASSGGTESPVTETGPASTALDQLASGVDGSSDSPYLKELNKNIRNIQKKLASSSKADAVIAANPDESLDDLVAAKKINADQKAQVLKKPALQAQLTQLAEQVSQYRSFGRDYEERFAREKSTLKGAHESDILKAREEAAAEAEIILAKRHDAELLLLSQFLHAAAAKRHLDPGSADSDEARAFEGALLLVYQGNSQSLATLKNLVLGSDDRVPDVHGELIDYTFASLKQSSIDDAPPLIDAVEDDTADMPASIATEDASSTAVNSDPTIAHAGLTELEDTNLDSAVNGVTMAESTDAPDQSSTTQDAANAVAGSGWDAQASMASTGDEWVEVPRDPAETETGLNATPAGIQNATSWAEEVHESAVAEEKVAAENDGFEQVVHHHNRERGRGRGRGGDFRGGRGRGEGFRGGRGRGDRGDGGERRGGRGRGRGEGFRGGNRGARGRDAPNGGAASNAAAGSGW